MASPEPAPGRQRCAVHVDRPSVDRCSHCGRPSCLVCAVPFRGVVLCRTCASRALGTPDPEDPPVPLSTPRASVVLGGILAAGLIASLPPWHRSGTLTDAFTAWRPTELPVFVAVLALASAEALVVIAAVLGRSGRRILALVGLLSTVAVGATAFSLVRAPDFYAWTPAPFLTMVAALAASAVCLVRLRRAAPPPVRVTP